MSFTSDGRARRNSPALDLINVPPVIDPARPIWDQDGRRAEIMFVSMMDVSFPITALVARDGCKSPMVFDRLGKSRRGPQFYITNTKVTLMSESTFARKPSRTVHLSRDRSDLSEPG